MRIDHFNRGSKAYPLSFTVPLKSPRDVTMSALV
jgi:hypothetical protein